MEPVTGPVEDRLRPSGWWYALGAALVAVGGVLGLVLFVTAFVGALGAVEDFDRVSVPGDRVLTFPAGERSVYVECTGPRFCPWPDVEIYDDAGRLVPLESSFVTETYDVNGRSGERMAVVDLPRAGAYEVVVYGEPGGAARWVAIGEPLFADVPGRLAVAALVGGGLALVGIVLLVVVGVRRSRAKRERQPPSGFGGPGPSAWGPAPGSWAPPPGGWAAPPAGGWGTPPATWAPPPPAGSWPPPQPPSGAPGSATWPPPPEGPPAGGWAPPGGGQG